MIKNEIGFNPADGILYTRTSGITTLEYILEKIERLASNKSLPRKLKLLEDAREATAFFSKNDLDIFHEKLELALGDYVSVQHAIVLNQPKSFALTMIMQRLTNNSKYRLEEFSTIEGAKEWLLF